MAAAGPFVVLPVLSIHQLDTVLFQTAKTGRTRVKNAFGMRARVRKSVSPDQLDAEKDR